MKAARALAEGVSCWQRSNLILSGVPLQIGHQTTRRSEHGHRVLEHLTVSSFEKCIPLEWLSQDVQVQDNAHAGQLTHRGHRLKKHAKPAPLNPTEDQILECGKALCLW